ncbi:MAG: response regulator, partial [Pseudomonadota bacterium]
MLPFYHPTTIVALDDDPVFLESFAFHYGEDFICQTFTRPEEAIRFCNERRDHSDVVRQLFRDDVDVGDAISVAPGDQVLRVESAGMRTLSSDPGRFEQLSLLCVDFSMPGLNGIDVCRQLRDHPIRKILLTGKAGDETAVKAFNEGLIDCFLMKQMADLPRILKREMESLQRSYFTELTRPVEVALSAHREDFGAHSGLRSYFLDIFDRRGICEYYRVLNPAGIAMIDDDGAPLFLSVCDEETMRAAEEIAAGEGAPEVLVRMLASRS